MPWRELATTGQGTQETQDLNHGAPFILPFHRVPGENPGVLSLCFPEYVFHSG